MFREILEGKTVKFKDLEADGNITDDEAVIDLLKDYDFFTSMIDSMPQMKQAEKDNDSILQKLKKLGVKSISHNKFSTPMSPVRKKTIEIK